MAGAKASGAGFAASMTQVECSYTYFCALMLRSGIFGMGRTSALSAAGAEALYTSSLKLSAAGGILQQAAVFYLGSP